MTLDSVTLLIALVTVCSVLAALLTASWLQNRGVPSLGLWTAGFGLCALSGSLLVAQSQLGGGFLFLDLANALRIVAFGLGWQAARHLAGRRGDWLVIVVPAAAVLIVSRLPPFDQSVWTRVIVGSPVIMAYALASAWELWRGGKLGQWIGRPAAIFLVVHAAVTGFILATTLARIPTLVDHATATQPFTPFVLIEKMVAAITLAFLLLSAAKEEVGLQHRRAALLDPLTGIGNRRGFEAEAGRMLACASRSDASMALLILDLDHFKSVNDTFGHPAGDRILRSLADTLTSALRPGDVVGRIGGEEFAIAISRSGTEQAVALAERIRRAVASMSTVCDGRAVSLTVSIGVASLSRGQTLEALFDEADAALYRAKERGRNRVEPSAPGAAPTLVRPPKGAGVKHVA